ncbi:hypothetical protein [Cellulosimicrobium cellulans]|uniref:hypothetical protein n=2 Tax=Cellulosimicrobium cellulans TaxID=1710 RepID=UPI0028ABA4B9|nr:hypothetical protein [Cellulosimicrobium cellulans]
MDLAHVSSIASGQSHLRHLSVLPGGMMKRSLARLTTVLMASALLTVGLANGASALGELPTPYGQPHDRSAAVGGQLPTPYGQPHDRSAAGVLPTPYTQPHDRSAAVGGQLPTPYTQGLAQKPAGRGFAPVAV